MIPWMRPVSSEVLMAMAWCHLTVDTRLCTWSAGSVQVQHWTADYRGTAIYCCTSHFGGVFVGSARYIEWYCRHRSKRWNAATPSGPTGYLGSATMCS